VSEPARRYPIGSELISPEQASVRVWAPSSPTLELWLDGTSTRMCAEPDGYFSATLAARTGSRYAFRFPDDERLYPDPASKSQPDGPEGLSEIVDLAGYRWGDAAWSGIELRDQVFYEVHIGTFTNEGTWRAAEAELGRLRDIGITVIQMMPIGEFAGAFGWGYDGVQWFAPTHNYGTPTDFQHFVDAAHQRGLGVILDVVYNHLGPSGNFLARFSPRYFTDKYANEWGAALNFDGEDSSHVRELVLCNAAYWLREFHVDGFRIDAAQEIHDDSPEHVLAAIARTSRETSATPVVLLAEHEPQHARLIRTALDSGYGLDGIYHEDFHHSIRVALTGAREAYFSDYTGASDEWLAAALSGFLFQGQYYPWQSAPRGAPALDRPAWQFICFLENHDQVANSPTGRRLIDLTHPSWWRAMSALLVLGPWTPLIFQGQESGSSRPFRYFCDHTAKLQTAVLEGRRLFLSQFGRMTANPANTVSLEALGRDGFEASRLIHEAESRRAMVSRLYRDLLALRKGDPSLGNHSTRLTGATLGDRAMLLRYLGNTRDADRLLVVNLGADMNLASLAQPLVAPPAGHHWSVMWCSEDPQYGGSGAAASAPPARLIATGHAATIFQPRLIDHDDTPSAAPQETPIR
jgi:maltooligosyltrehalose trehalohydrolase